MEPCLYTRYHTMSTSVVFSPFQKVCADPCPESYVCQVAPRTCVRCPRASLREGVTLQKLPVQQRRLEPLLASSLSTGTCSKTACVQVTEHDGVWAAGPPALLHARSLSTVLRDMLHWWKHVRCTHATSRSKGHATQLRNWLPQPARCLHSSTYGDHHRPAPACHAP